MSNLMARLEGKGLPWSIRFLIKSLLDFSEGDIRGDDAYSSFIELQQDLSFMLDDPSRFVDNIQLNGSLPMLDIRDKLYGREGEMAKLNELYKQCIRETSFKGVLISGGAGWVNHGLPCIPNS